MGSSPVISTPSKGHEHVPEVCRIHSAIPPCGIMTAARLHLPGPTQRRISISFLPAEDVEGGFGQMPRYRAHGPAVSLALAQPRVELADVPLRAAGVVHRHGVGGFRERPLEITIHIRAGAPVAAAKGRDEMTWA